MDLYEYQAKDLFAAHGVPVLPGKTVETPREAAAAARELGGTVVVKAQVKTGGRGKAGGVKLAATPEEAEEKAAAILGLDIKGHTVHRVLVTEASDIAEEYYFSFLLDRSNRTFLAMASAEGGMDIEQLAVERPEALAKVPVDAIAGVDRAKAADIVAHAKIPADVADAATDVIVKLWQTFVSEDATLVEVNPLVRTPEGEVIALDGKVTLDDNADFRHPGHADLVDSRTEDPLEAKAKAKDLNYVKLDGQVGIIGNGAGLVMSTLDVVAYAGEPLGVKPANFLDIGGGASAEVMAAGLDVVLGDPAVKSVFVNVFGGITACDAVANGIVEALKMLGDQATKPLVVRLDGNNVEEGRRILDEATHPLVTQVDTMDNAAKKAAELARRGPEHHVDLPQREQQGHRPGHDRRRGHQAHHQDARGGHRHRRRRQRPQGRHQRDHRRAAAAGLRHRRRGHEGDRRRRERAVRAAALRQGRRHRGDRRRDRARGRDHRGDPGARHGLRVGARLRAGEQDPDHRPELPRDHLARASRTPASSPPTSPAPARSAWSRSRAR